MLRWFKKNSSEDNVSTSNISEPVFAIVESYRNNPKEWAFVHKFPTIPTIKKGEIILNINHTVTRLTHSDKIIKLTDDEHKYLGNRLLPLIKKEIVRQSEEETKERSALEKTIRDKITNELRGENIT